MRSLIALIVLSSTALADVSSQSAKTVDCYCTDRTGSRVELGQTICMQVDGRMFLAECQMSLNVPMWREISTGCLTGEAPNFTPVPAHG